MAEQIFEFSAKNSFNKARIKEIIFKLFNIYNPSNQTLLSFNEIRKLLNPTNISYQGIKAVKLSLIVGSEGRYRDFNKIFLPRFDYLRGRWESIEMAHLKEYNLPPVKLYELGGVYFVQDGNHRISVAKLREMEYIDAEIISLKSEIKLSPRMAKEDIKKAIIKYEKDNFFKNEEYKLVIDKEKLTFTEIGRYHEVEAHIQVHKYFINLNQPQEISYQKAVTSWYYNLFLPTIYIINENNILARFPGRTEADLYLWIVTHWDFLKKKYGHDYSLQEAGIDFSKRYGKHFLIDRISKILNLLLWKIFKKKVKE